jgi:hypothetical protein
MVATFSWREYNVTAGDSGVPTNLNLGSSTGRNIAPSTYPITAGTYSYSKWVRGEWTGDFTRIENLKFWCSASGSGTVTGEQINFSGTTESYGGTTTYATPTNGADAQAVGPLIYAAPSTANIGFTGVLAASLTTSADGSNRSDFIVIQASIGAAASAGATQQKTFTLQYDEV